MPVDRLQLLKLKTSPPIAQGCTQVNFSVAAFRYLRLIVFAWMMTGSIAWADQLQLIDGSVIDTTVNSISPDGIVTGDGIASGVELKKIAAYQSQSTSLVPGSVELSIAGKGKIFTSNLTINGANATVTLSDGTTIDMPLEVVQAIVFKSTELVNKRMTAQSDSEDSVVVQTPSGEKVVTGIFEGLSAGKVQLNFKGKSRKIGIGKVNAVVLADLGLNPVRGAKVELHDRSLVNGRVQEFSNGTLFVAVTSTSIIKIPWSSVAEIEFESDNLAYLSDLTPLSVDQKSIFAPQRIWQRDRSIESNPIRLRKINQRSYLTFRKGIGTQAYCELTFANSNDFRRFQATVGIDAETDGRGDCQMSIHADGIQLWTQRITGQTPPVEIDVDITGMETLTLTVQPGAQFDLADHANWADARFVKP